MSPSKSSGRKALLATTKPDPTKPIALRAVTTSQQLNSENASRTIAIGQAFANSVGINGVVTAIEQNPGGVVVVTVRHGSKWNDPAAGVDKYVIIFSDTVGEAL